MKRINLTKYGFVRWPEEDFSDDGNRFTCFRAGKRVRASKLVSEGQAYLSCSSTVGNGTLPYDVYSKLPHYSTALWRYNGVSIDTLTEQDLIDFYNACVSYEKEYEEAEANIVYPTLEELTEQCEKVWAKHNREYAEAQKIVSDSIITGDFLKLSRYQLDAVQRHLISLSNQVKNNNPKVRPQLLLGKSSSFGFMKPDLYELTHEDYYLKSIKEIFFKEIRQY
jgi:hypothetical protein